MAAGLVPDASVVVAALVDSGPEGRWAEEQLAGATLMAPDLVVVEVLNILRRLEHAGNLAELVASLAQQDLGELAIELLPPSPFADRIWQLRHNLTCYDAWYVAIAEAFELPLATLDRRLAHASGPRCPIRTPD